MQGPSRSLLLFRSIYAILTSVSKLSVFFIFETGGPPYEMDRPPAVSRAPVGIAEHPGLPADHHLTTFSSRSGWLIVFDAPTFFYNHHKQRGNLCGMHKFPRCIMVFACLSQFCDSKGQRFEQPVPAVLRPGGQKSPCGAFLGRGLANLFGRNLFGFVLHPPYGRAAHARTLKMPATNTPQASIAATSTRIPGSLLFIAVPPSPSAFLRYPYSIAHTRPHNPDFHAAPKMRPPVIRTGGRVCVFGGGRGAL